MPIGNLIAGAAQIMANSAALSLSRRHYGWSWPLAVGLFSFCVMLALGPRDLADPDIFMHLVTGRWILAHGAVPHADFLSFSMQGAPWTAHEWLSEVLTALAYDAMGWHGVVVLASLCLALAMAALTRALLRSLEPIYVLVLVAVTLLLLLPHLIARPHLFVWPLLVAWVAALCEARDAKKPPPLTLALIMIPWVNLHGSFLFGLGFAVLLGAEAVADARDMRDRMAAARQWGAFIAVSALASLVTPNGFDAYLLPYHLLGMKYVLSILVEWQSPGLGMFQPLEVWLLGALLTGFTLRLTLPIARLLIVLLLVHMALGHWRHETLLAFAVPLLIAQPVAAQIRPRFARSNAAGLDRLMATLVPPAGWGGMAVAGLLMAALTAIATTKPLDLPSLYRPEAAVQAALDHPIAGPVLNDYNFGGYLIFAGIPTFIDGRADMYGDAFVERDGKAVQGLNGELPALLDEYKITWTLFAPDSPAVVQLDRLPGWRRLYADDVAVVHIRTGNGPG